MGITGLLPLLKSIQRPIELKKYAGETIAVDAYGWLHRAAISCAAELAQDRPTRRYVDGVLNRVRMVQHFGVTPYLVFDGDFLPSKAATEVSRARRRDDSRAAGMQLQRAGNPKQAYAEFQKAIDVTPEMARQVIEELKRLGLPYIVAPYEADAQMVYLERLGLVSGILSEDSDLLVFGARRLLTKLDMQGRCIEINRRDFCACREIALTDWTDREFRHMAILSGCDYLDGIGNIGLKTAYRMIRKHKTVEKVVRMLQFDGKFKVSENYLAAFRQAELTFLHQRVFCPKQQKLVLLSEPTDGLDVDGMRFIGDKIDNELARAISIGDVNPITKEPIVLPPSPGKKRRASSSAAATSASPFRPAFPPNAQSEQAAFGKPISDYFGKRPADSPASRIPLGAMDPNCFAVDRKQLAVLTQNGLVPRVFPLPRPYVDGGHTTLSSSPGSAEPRRTLSSLSSASSSPRLRRRQTEPLSSLLQLGGTSSKSAEANRRRMTLMAPPASVPRGSITTSEMPASSSSSVRPQKKARLSQGGTGENPPGKGFERSKYFSSAPTAATPSAEEKAKAEAATERRHAGEGFLFSDDSVEEAMLSLPDWDSWDDGVVPARPSISVFDDSLQKAGEADTLPCDPASDGIEVPESPVMSAKKRTTQIPVDEGPPSTSRKTFLRQFSYTPGSIGNPVGGARMAHGLPTPESSFVGNGSSQRGTASLTRVKKSLSTATATPPSSQTRTGPRFSLSDLVDSAPRPLRTARPPKTSSGRGLDKLRRSLEASAPKAVNPSFVPLPPADLAEVAALNSSGGGGGAEGSEDLLVPDSDGEEEEPEELEGQGADEAKPRVLARTTRPQLDLSRFLCA